MAIDEDAIIKFFKDVIAPFAKRNQLQEKRRKEDKRQRSDAWIRKFWVAPCILTFYNKSAKLTFHITNVVYCDQQKRQLKKFYEFDWRGGNVSNTIK